MIINSVIYLYVSINRNSVSIIFSRSVDRNFFKFATLIVYKIFYIGQQLIGSGHSKLSMKVSVYDVIAA